MSPFESIALIRYRAAKLGVELEGVWLNENDTKALAEFMCHHISLGNEGQLGSMLCNGIILEPFRLCGLTIHSVKT